MRLQFDTLTNLLTKHQAIWKTPVFQMQPNLQSIQNSSLQHFLSQLSDDEIEHLQANDQALLDRLSPFFPDASTLSACIHFPPTQQASAFAPPKFWNTDIPGRKEQQILAFTEALGAVNHSLLEWCCGKQHLSRLLAEVHQQEALGLDIDSALIKQARSLADKRHLQGQVVSHCCDVFSDQAETLITSSQHLLALHACGGLHTRLLQLGAKQGVPRISFSPCCYHRFNDSDNYQALSQAGKASNLSINQEGLRLAVRETQTATNAETVKRKTLQSWRLGFDCLQREVRQSDSYLTLPSFSHTILQAGFEHFCRQAAELKQLELPHSLDFAHYLQQGERRFDHYQRLELLRMAFRRALECWLVLDKALFLEEVGYHCEISTFCAASVTPRNLLVNATRSYA